MITCNNKIKSLLAALCLFSVLPACGDAGFGATPGGVQDINFARDIVDAGNVPPPEAFFVEGIFSEHDLPLEGEVCESTLCLRAATGVAPDATGKEAGWIQVGLSSNIVPENFEHPSQTIIAVVDVSCSMGWAYGQPDDQEEAMTAGQVTKRLLREMAKRLRPQDNLAIITYGSSVSTELDITSGNEKEDIEDAIDDLDSGGVTNMEAGLEEAYELAEDAKTNTEKTRLILFTDVQPNVGATDAGSFRDMVKRGAEKNIALTVIGAGIGMGVEIFGAMADLKGGNAFSLSKGSDINALMEESWPWMLVPIASDLEMSLETPSSIGIESSYGFPNGGKADEDLMKVSTVFLSRKRGALLLKLTDANEQIRGQALSAELRYKDYEQQEKLQTLQLSFPTSTSTNTAYIFEQSSVGRATALALLVTGMKKAAELYQEDRPAATEMFRPIVARIVADAEFFDDDGLREEAKFAQKMLKLMEEEAPQGNFYGRF